MNNNSTSTTQTETNIQRIHTTEMTMEVRSQKQADPMQNNLRVSQEFLGGRFDTKG